MQRTKVKIENESTGNKCRRDSKNAINDIQSSEGFWITELYELLNHIKNTVDTMKDLVIKT